MLVNSKAEHEVLGEGWGDSSAVWREVDAEKEQIEAPKKEDAPYQEPAGVVEEPKHKGKKNRK